jgi:hypothetical protein
MKNKGLISMVTALSITMLVFATNSARAQKMPAESMTLKLENAKLAPVTFSHSNHAKAMKCSVCHHKDKNPTEPEKCETCHMLKEVRNRAIPITDAFHKQCQTCHKQAKSRGVGAPESCNECHKK